MNRRALVPFVLSGLLALAIAAPTMAGHGGNHANTVQKGGAAGLVAVVAQVAATVQVEDINIANRSLNNLLRNADIDVLNNVLNNTLRDADIEITRVIDGNNVVVNVLSSGVQTGNITVSP
jgi:hypothetical protein